MPKLPIEAVFSAIRSERAYQDHHWPDNSRHGEPNPLTIGEQLLLLEEYCRRARETWAHEKKPEGQTLHVVRKIAGIAVNCMQQHGAPPREGFEGHV